MKNRVENQDVEFPVGYRSWTHVKTYVVGPKSLAFPFIGGFNHVYANEKAMIGYHTGRFPNGSVIVSDVIKAKEDSVDTREGKRHHIDVMVRDSIRYSSNDGWTFEQFSDITERKRLLIPDTRKSCVKCHLKQSDHVFSVYRN